VEPVGRGSGFGRALPATARVGAANRLTGIDSDGSNRPAGFPLLLQRAGDRASQSMLLPSRRVVDLRWVAAICSYQTPHTLFPPYFTIYSRLDRFLIRRGIPG
jgi:hypothetical protein